jgi:hypothetical protein
MTVKHTPFTAMLSPIATVETVPKFNKKYHTVETITKSNKKYHTVETVPCGIFY